MIRQRTIRAKTSWTGIGLHSGQRIKVEILPAPEGNGITFERTDRGPHAELRACVEHVADTQLATTLGVGVNGSRVTVGTVEHLLAALSGLGIDNARVLVNGPEIPILDGSATAFVEGLLEAGIERQRKSKRYLVIRREVKVQEGDKVARITPGRGLRITCSLDFDHPLISPQPFRFDFSERAFVRDLARARTFGFLQDVEALQANGLALGGSLDNAIVIDHYRVLNPEGLRFSDEFVRHKILDAIGDFSLAGMPLVGRAHLHRSGHSLNTQLIAEVLSDARNYEIVQPEPEQAADIAVHAAEEVPFNLLEPAESLA